MTSPDAFLIGSGIGGLGGCGLVLFIVFLWYRKWRLAGAALLAVVLALILFVIAVSP